MSGDTRRWRVMGIDPAPKKAALIYDGDAFCSIEPGQLRNHILNTAQQCTSLLIAWDAPLSFDSTDFYDRLVDKAARKWIKKQVSEKRFAEKAISARALAGLPHWAVSCFTLGLPFEEPPYRVALLRHVPTEEQIGLFAVEVHPAVAMGAQWISLQLDEPFPSYKGNPTACAEIAKWLSFPEEAGEDDDTLDAYVAYWLGQLFLSGEASWLGDPDRGAYIMPDCTASNELRSMLAADWQR